MKKCLYCGKSYSDELTHCPIDAELLQGLDGSGPAGPNEPPRADPTDSRWAVLLVVFTIGVLVAAWFQSWVVWPLLIAMWALFSWSVGDSGVWWRRKTPLKEPEPEEEENIPPEGEKQVPIRALLVRAQKTVEGLIARLPADLRAEVEKVPCFIEDWPGRGRILTLPP